MPRDPDAPERVTATRAKTAYGLDAWSLDCMYCVNPVYRSAAPMRLYVLDDVIAVSDMKKIAVSATDSCTSP